MSDGGALLSALGGKALATIATGYLSRFSNYSNDTPLYISSSDIEDIKNDIILKKRVILDVAQEATG